MDNFDFTKISKENDCADKNSSLRELFNALKKAGIVNIDRGVFEEYAIFGNSEDNGLDKVDLLMSFTKQYSDVIENQQAIGNSRKLTKSQLTVIAEDPEKDFATYLLLDHISALEDEIDYLKNRN